MNRVQELQDWLKQGNLGGIVVPSTDEYLSEFAPPAKRRLRWATGFLGSTGVAIVLRDAAALFLDGRYRLQGAEDTEGSAIDIEPASFAARREWIKARLAPGSRVGLDPNLHSITEMTQWSDLAADLDLQLAIIADNPIDLLWRDVRPHEPLIVDYPERYAGLSYVDKCSAVTEHVASSGMAGLLLADPEDVSWLLNVRAEDRTVKTRVGEWWGVPSCTSMAIVGCNGTVTWFVDEYRLTPELRARADKYVKVAPPGSLVSALRDLAREGPVGADPRRTPAALATVIQQSGRLVTDNTTARRRWRKHRREVECARRAYLHDAVAVVRLMTWLTRTVAERPVTEFEVAEQLESLRAENPEYKGASMPLMSASGPSGAQPHYVPRQERCRTLNDHPLYWLDSGGHYPGGTTDNTVVLAIGTPEPKHVLAHTVVLQGLIALSNTRFPAGIAAIRLDSIARQWLWREGMDFSHSTGHGVGNYLNIHEGPLIGSEPGPVTMVPLEPGMIVSNEPAYYAPGDFGVRLETNMLIVQSSTPSFLEFETLSRLPIDPRLVDFSRLSNEERQWLAVYHRSVLRDLEALLDRPSAEWLKSCVEKFSSAAIE